MVIQDPDTFQKMISVLFYPMRTSLASPIFSPAVE